MTLVIVSSPVVDRSGYGGNIRQIVALSLQPDRILRMRAVRSNQLQPPVYEGLLNEVPDIQTENWLTRPRYLAPSATSGILRLERRCNRSCQHSKPEPG